MHHTRKATPLLGLAALGLTAPTARAQTLIDQSNEVADLSFGLGSNGDTAVGQTFTKAFRVARRRKPLGLSKGRNAPERFR